MFHHATVRTAIVVLPLLGLWAERAGAQMDSPAVPGDAATRWMPLTPPGLAALPVPARTPSSSAFYEGFEGSEPSWHEAGGDARYRIEFHQRVAGEAHTGTQCEKFAIAADSGTSVYICHEVGQALLIDELLPTVWIRSDRSGLQMFAEVVLPRTRDPRTGRPISALIAGSSYSALGQWQQLRLDDLPRALTRRARILRAEFGPEVDEREAYVVRIVLNAYGGPGVTTLWIDDLDLAGYLARPATLGPSASGSAGLSGAPLNSSGPAPVTVSPNPALGDPQAQNDRAPIKVELTGSVLLTDGRPIFPRILQYRGEPLALLARMGFNAVWLDQPPSKEILEEAERLPMWLVCPPPRPPAAPETDDRVRPLHEIGPEYRRVLAWDLGRGLFAENLEVTRRWADQVREATHRCNRPLIGQAESELRSYSRHLNLLLFGRQPLGTSLELSDYGTWVRGRPLLARPGTPAWTTIQTQLSPAVEQQLRALDPARAPPLVVTSEQIRLLVYTAIAAGSRGVLFESSSPLNADDPDTQQRAMSLELVNMELSLIEPWIAGGTVVATLTGSSSEIGGAMLRSDHARLLLPIWMTPGAQYVPGQAAGNNVTVVAPGVPESSRPYEIIPGGLRPLRKNRAMGGMQVTLDEFGLVAPVLLSQDPPIVAELSRQSIVAGPRMAELLRHLAARKLQIAQQVSSELLGRVPAPKSSADWIPSARRNMQACDDLLAEKRFQEAYISAQRVMRALRLYERAYWETTVAKLTSPVVSPAAISYATLPVHLKLVERIAALRPGPNVLEGGEFEDMGATLRSGWRHFEHRMEGTTGQVDMVSGAAHRGHFGLRLAVRPEDPKNPPAMLESSPLWITSPSVPVRTGDLVCVRGWIRIPTPLTSTVDGLLVFDSLGGETLGERIGHTNQWREFALYRIAPRDGDLNITFALYGMGEVHLDDVAVQILQSAPPRSIGQRLFPFGR